MKIAVAGDSAGEELAKILADHLKDRFEVSEISRTQSGPDTFYANLADRVASEVSNGTYDRAILCCGTGIGVCIAANKVPGIRAALVSDAYSAGKAATSNNAQIVTLGARTIAAELAKTIVDSYLDKAFDPNGPSARNVDAINSVDASYNAN
ncbi:MAG: RpiB/LacA/LacB family sugar-phosphate isomerase [Roseibium sp.]